MVMALCVQPPDSKGGSIRELLSDVQVLEVQDRRGSHRRPQHQGVQGLMSS